MAKQQKLLIIGDSFATSTDDVSWVNHLQGFDVDNRSSNGASEYRLINAMRSVRPDEYDCVIFVHTSPNRIYVENNPYYQNSGTHRHCDLIYKDVCSRLPDPYAQHVAWFYENVFDLAQAQYVHNLLINDAVSRFPDAVHITFFDYTHNKVESLYNIWENNPGNINHMNAAGNTLVGKYITDKLKELTRE